MAKASGTIYKEGTQSKLSGAVVKANSAQGDMFSTVSDNQGEFHFDNLQPGEWTIVAIKENYYSSQSQKLDLAVDRTDLSFELARRMDTVDEKAGRIFFYALLGVLVGLIITYIVLHLVFPKVNGSEATQKSFLWVVEPFRFIEVLFWGLAGVLIDKLMSIGYYLRRGTFYREGILMHISHLVSVPLLVLVVVFILSLVTLSITLAGNEVTLDLADPRVLVAVSFILGSRPWALRDFIRRTSEKITQD